MAGGREAFSAGSHVEEANPGSYRGGQIPASGAETHASSPAITQNNVMYLLAGGEVPDHEVLI
jgi:hypothetical protein